MRPLKVLTYEEAGRVATVTLGAPIHVSLIADLEAICQHLQEVPACDVVVFRGSAERFCGEIDLREFNTGKPLDIHGFHRWEKALSLIEGLDRVTIAAVHGRCMGAGLQLALACDLRLADRGATLGLDEVKRGFLPGMATFRLARYIGVGRAKQLTVAGRVLTADEAERWGLVDRVAAGAEFDAALSRLIDEVQPVNRVAVELNRRLLNESYAIQYEEFVGNFLAAQHRAITSEAFQKQLESIRES